METTRSATYTDLGGLNDIKRLGKSDDAAAIHKVAQQFESMFVSMLMKSMRETNKVFSEGDPMQSSEMELHQDMYDQQLSLRLSTSGHGMGLADVLERQLSKQYVHKVPEKNTTPAGLQFKPVVKATPAPAPLSAVVKPVSASVVANIVANKPGEVATKQDAKVDFSSPEKFIASVYEHAKQAAKELGVKTEVLISQAALETGWGKSIIGAAAGKNSNNLFGIKAHGGWKGDAVKASSLEVVQGVVRPEVSSFRAYGSIADSFKDYVSFLKSNPRYADALKAAADPKEYTRQLQKAGYSTDPDYAEKIQRIMQYDIVAQAGKPG